MKNSRSLLLPLMMMLITTALAFACGQLFDRWLPGGADTAELAPDMIPRALEQVVVHGEAARISAGGALISLAGTDGENDYRYLYPAASGYVNQGIKLYELPAAEYRVLGDDLPLLIGETPLAEGYTLTRNGQNKHWRFWADADGLLNLTVRDVDSLPEDVYDIFIDVGHGGTVGGAAAFGYIEAELNLQTSLYMRDRLTELGLKAKLSREGSGISGGEAAENNPYISGARLDSVYRSGAKYLFSNHLNAGGERGFQIYSSVRTDTKFAECVAENLRAAGHRENNNGIGLVANGVYKRCSEVFSEAARDYYFILRESGGYALSPYRYRLHNNDMTADLARGAESLLLEYAFIDNRDDLNYWLANYQNLVDAVIAGAAAYWQL